MGRAFEFRKERKMKRWGHMAKTFTKLGKEITIAVKQGGAEVTGNPRLRALIAEAKSEQMPKENIERAIKKATEAKSGDFKEIIYEGFGPFGICSDLASAMRARRRGLPVTSAPPCLTAMVISFPSLVKVLAMWPQRFSLRSLRNSNALPIA